jgi:DNA-binding transcriptional MocR family regulator
VSVKVGVWRHAILRAPIANRKNTEPGALSTNAKYVGLALSVLMNPDGTNCYPSMDTLATEMGKSKATVHAAIHELLATGWLTVKPGAGKRSNLYSTALPPSVSGTAAVPLGTPGKRRDTPQETPLAVQNRGSSGTTAVLNQQTKRRATAAAPDGAAAVGVGLARGDGRMTTEELVAWLAEQRAMEAAGQ